MQNCEGLYILWFIHGLVLRPSLLHTPCGHVEHTACKSLVSETQIL